MGVSLSPISGGSILPEYAASNISLVRSIRNVNGEIVPLFTASINYIRTDYLLNGEGKKVGVVSDQLMAMEPNSERLGYISVDETQIAGLWSTEPADGIGVGKAIADMADTLIREDLIRRGILTA